MAGEVGRLPTSSLACGACGIEVDQLAQLAVDYSDSLYRFARSLVRSSEQAEDLVQQTFERALVHRDQFKGGSAISWLKKILHNLVIDSARHSSFEMPVEGEALASQVEAHWMDSSYSVDPQVVLERAEAKDRLEEALIRVPYGYRAVVVLHDEEGLTLKEIADLMSLGLPAVKQRLRRGRMMVVSALAEGDERREALVDVPMTCWSARHEVSDYIDGDLGSSERLRLEAHLAQCPTCPPLYAALVGVKAELGRLRDPDSVIPPQMAGKLAEKIRAEGSSRSQPAEHG